MSRKVITFDAILCTGCLQCELVCSINKTGIANPINSRITVAKGEERGVYKPVICSQCDPAPCMEACPVEAMKRDRETGAVLIDENTCTRCGECIAACSFGAVKFSAEGSVIKCDLCGGDPTCVKYCQERPENSSAFMSNPRGSALQFVGSEMETRNV